MTTRRQFIGRVAAAAAAGAVAAPAGCRALLFGRPNGGERTEITFDFVMRGFQSFSLGWEAPTLVIVGPASWERLRVLCGSWTDVSRLDVQFLFEGVPVISSSGQPEDRVTFINERHPTYPHLNGTWRIGQQTP